MVLSKEDKIEILEFLHSMIKEHFEEIPSSGTSVILGTILDSLEIKLRKLKIEIAPILTNAIENIKMLFPEDIECMLSFTEKDDYIVIKPRQFLGQETFSKVASVVRSQDGEYISAGRESHFKIPIRKK